MSIFLLITVFSSLYEALSMEPPAYFPQMCKKALRAALSLHKKQPQADLAHSRHIHHYLQDFVSDQFSDFE